MQSVDTGEILMQAFANREAVSETLQTGYGQGTLMPAAPQLCAVVAELWPAPQACNLLQQITTREVVQRGIIWAFHQGHWCVCGLR